MIGKLGVGSKQVVFDDSALNVFKSETTQDTNIVVTVGIGGDYPTINEALGYLSKKKLKYGVGIKAEIKLLSGFIMQEQVYVEGINLGWIRITSVDATVTINRVSLTAEKVNIPPHNETSSAVISYGAFCGMYNAILPVIAVLFIMDETGSQANRDAFFVGKGSQITIEQTKGCINAGQTGIYCVEGARVVAVDVNISNAKGNGISCFRGGYVSFRGGDASGAGAYGIYLDNTSVADASSANFLNSTSGVWVDGNSMLSCSYSNISNSGGHAIIAGNGSIVDAHGATLDGATQRGVSCDAGMVIVKNASIKNAGTDGIYCINNGTVDAESADITGGTNNGIYALKGGKVNAYGANAQKIIGTNGNDFRVVNGGIIIANSGIGGTYGSVPNTVSAGGIIIKDGVSVGFTGTLSARVVWSTGTTNLGSSTIPLDNADIKTVTITAMDVYFGAVLTEAERALISIEKTKLSVSFKVNNADLALKLSGQNTKITLTVS